MGALNRPRSPAHLIREYAELEALLRYYYRIQVQSFDQAAQGRFTDLRKQGVRIGTMDLRIASIALVTGATVLSRNLRDFRQVPDLVLEDRTQ